MSEAPEKKPQKLYKRISKKQSSLVQESYLHKIGQYRVNLSKLIGVGSFGNVYSAQKDDSKQSYACKLISRKKLNDLELYNKQYAEQMMKRFRIESKFQSESRDCPNIVTLFDSHEDQKGLYFFMELCDSDLSKQIRLAGVLQEEQAVAYFQQLLKGYEHIFNRNAFHRDLKLVEQPENLLLRDGILKISDFGFVKVFEDLSQSQRIVPAKTKRAVSRVGSLKYMSPDLLSLCQKNIQNSYDPQKSDVWSMGIIMYKMLYGKEPYSGKNESQMIQKIQNSQLQFPQTVVLAGGAIRPVSVSTIMIQFIRRMLHKNEKDRIGFVELVEEFQNLRIQVQSRSSQSYRPIFQKHLAINNVSKMIVVYTYLTQRLYHDVVNYATLREIQIHKYFELTFYLINSFHQKRMEISLTMGDENQQQRQLLRIIKEFQTPFGAEIAKMSKQNLYQKSVIECLTQVYDKIIVYEHFDILDKQPQLMLLALLLILSFELKVVDLQLLIVWFSREETANFSTILEFKDSTISKIKTAKVPSN